MMVLGRIYEMGIVEKQDLQKAFAYYDSAAQNCMEPYAIYKIGEFYEKGEHPDCPRDKMGNREPNYEMAFKYFQSAF